MQQFSGQTNMISKKQKMVLSCLNQNLLELSKISSDDPVSYVIQCSWDQHPKC
jgi:hypothetical protein